MDPKDLLDALEACRPGSDDLSQPEMSPLAQALETDLQLQRLLARSQSWDARLTEAVQDVPVPEGLGQRLLDQAMVHRRRDRRRLLCYGGLLAAAASGLGGVGIYFLRRPPTTQLVSEELAKSVLEWLDAPGSGDPLRADSAPLQEYPKAAECPAAVTAWKRLPEKLGDGVVYWLDSGRRGVTARAISRRLGKGEVSHESPLLPEQPRNLSGPFTEYGLGARQMDGFLFVLLVRPRQRYEDLVAPLLQA